MLHDAANRVELQPRAFDMLGSLGLDIGATTPEGTFGPGLLTLLGSSASEVGKANVHRATDVRQVPRSFAPRLPW